MLDNFIYRSLFRRLGLLMVGVWLGLVQPLYAQDNPKPEVTTAISTGAPKEQTEALRGAFDGDHGTWLHPLARAVFGDPEPQHEKGEPPSSFSGVKHDYMIISLLLMIALGVVGTMAARLVRVKPEGRPTSLANLAEASVEGFQTYLVGVMGRELAIKYTPLIASFFFAILFFNWVGLIPGMVAPTSNPNVPFALAIVGFVCVHFIAIREAGFKSWFMHLVGEPLWMAPLAFPLHVVGELVKPVSLSLRLLGNIFGDEIVVAQIALLSIAAMAVLKVPIPLQFPIMVMGLFFGFLQAIVFATLLAIYIAIFCVHSGDHDEHNAHGHVEHTQLHGHEEIIAHPSEVTFA